MLVQFVDILIDGEEKLSKNEIFVICVQDVPSQIEVSSLSSVCLGWKKILPQNL